MSYEPGPAREESAISERPRATRRALALRALVALAATPMLPACSGPSTGRGAAPTVSASASEATARGCDVAALEAKGDLDGVLAALDACGELSLDERMRRVDVLVTLGDVGPAKASAADVARRAREAGSAGDAIQERADRVLALDLVPRSKRDEIADARALVDKARAEREPARWIDLARARHAFTRATGERGKPVLVARGAGQAMAGERALVQVVLRDLPTGDKQVATAVAELDPRGSTLRVVELITPHVLLDRSSPIAPLPGERGAFIMTTAGGLRAFFTERELRPIDTAGTLTLSPDGRSLVVDRTSDVTVIDLASWTERFTHSGSRSTVARVTDDAVTLVSSDPQGMNDVVDLVTGKLIVHTAGTGALSPDSRTLAVLADESDSSAPLSNVKMHLYGLDGALRERAVSITGSSGYSTVDFDRHGRARVSEYGPGSQVCLMEARALIDVSTGRTVPVPKDERYRDCPGAGTFVELEPTPTGLTAKAESYAPTPELVVSKSGVVTQRVPLAMSGGFGVTTIVATSDDRFVLACGAGAAAGAFVVDVGTGRTTFMSDILDCSPVAFTGSRFVGTLGVRDLASDQSAPDWPATVSLPLLGEALFDELGGGFAPTSTPGLHCRFGELVAPYEVCGPPPPAPGAR